MGGSFSRGVPTKNSLADAFLGQDHDVTKGHCLRAGSLRGCDRPNHEALLGGLLHNQNLGRIAEARAHACACVPGCERARVCKAALHLQQSQR